jgi:hypothetical protein
VKAKLNKACALLEARPATASLAPELRACFQQAKTDAQPRLLAALGLVLVVCPALAWIIVFREDSELIGEALGDAFWVHIEVALQFAPVVILGLAVLIVLAVWVRGMYLSWRMARFLDECLGVDPEAVGAARRQVATGPAEVAFRTLTIAVPVVLVVAGLITGAFAFLAATAALDCARSSKCM